MRSSIQLSPRLRKRLAQRKRHPRQSYEEVIAEALDAATRAPAPGVPPGVAVALADLRTRLGALYGPRLVRAILYGSVARGGSRPDSDVDVLLVLRGEVDRAREIQRLVELTYDTLLDRGIHLSVLPMSEKDYLTQVTPLLLNVRREGVPL